MTTNNTMTTLEELAEAYSDERVMEAIESTMSEVEHRISDVTKVEERIYRNIARTVKRLANGRLTTGLIRRIVTSEVSSILNGGKYAISGITRFCEMDGNDSEGIEMRYEPEDGKGVTGEELLSFQETVNRIVPHGDERRRIIVEEWANGNTNDRDIARLLVNTVGGKERTHTGFITRFRTECRETLGGRGK